MDTDHCSQISSRSTKMRFSSEETISPNNNPNTISNTKLKSSNSSSTTTTSFERKAPRPQKEEALNCPRCNSTNTKFCYYNNYSLTQPRYFCKACKRYWTQGGSLRNIPLGGVSRKNKKHSFSTNLSSKIKPFPNHDDHHRRYLNLGFSQTQNNDQIINFPEFIQLPIIENPSKTHLTANSSGWLPRFLPNHQNRMDYSAGFPLHDDHFKTNTLNFGYGNLQGDVVDQQRETNNNINSQSDQSRFRSAWESDVDVTVLPMKEETTNNGRIFFSFEDLKPISNNTSVTLDNSELINRDEGNYSSGYWTGLMGSGASW